MVFSCLLLKSTPCPSTPKAAPIAQGLKPPSFNAFLTATMADPTQIGRSLFSSEHSTNTQQCFNMPISASSAYILWGLQNHNYGKSSNSLHSIIPSSLGFQFEDMEQIMGGAELCKNSYSFITLDLVHCVFCVAKIEIGLSVAMNIQCSKPFPGRHRCINWVIE